mgnify:CR=1 FL=1
MSSAAAVDEAFDDGAAAAEATVADEVADEVAEVDCLGCGEKIDPEFILKVEDDQNLCNWKHCEDCSCQCLTDSEGLLVECDIPGYGGCGQIKCTFCGIGCQCLFNNHDNPGVHNPEPYRYDSDNKQL